MKIQKSKLFEFIITDIAYRPAPYIERGAMNRNESNGYWDSVNGVVHNRGLILASSKKQARNKLEGQVDLELVVKYPTKIKLKGLYENLNTLPFKSFYFLTVEEVSPTNERIRQDYKLRECVCCGRKYTIVGNENKKQTSSLLYCSYSCESNTHKKEVAQQQYERSLDLFKYPFERCSNRAHPYIYRIKNKKTNGSYIGKSTTSYFARLHAHLQAASQSSNQQYKSKFYTALRKSNVEDWTFEVLERIPHENNNCSLLDEIHLSIISQREGYYIKLYDAVESGYNTNYAH